MESHNDVLATWLRVNTKLLMGRTVRYRNAAGAWYDGGTIESATILKCGCLLINLGGEDLWETTLMVERSESCKADRTGCEKPSMPVWGIFVVDELPTTIAETMGLDNAKEG